MDPVSNQVMNEELAEIKAIGGQELYDVSKRIMQCPKMFICLDLNDIRATIKGCVAHRFIVINCLGNEIPKQLERALSELTKDAALQPSKLLVFIELRGGSSIIMKNLQAFQKELNTLPSDISVLWGVGSSPTGASEIGLFIITGYKKGEGVSQNAPRID